MTDEYRDPDREASEEAVSMGQEAYLDGLELKDCPFTDIDGRRQWNRGFIGAARWKPETVAEEADLPEWVCPSCGFAGEPRRFAHHRRRWNICPRCRARDEADE